MSKFDTLGPSSLIMKYVVEGQGVKMGSLVNDLLFIPNEFDNKYFISKAKEPTSTLLNLSKIILENYEEIPSVEEILKIIKDNYF